MSLREFLAAIPKVELNLQLTGALQSENLLMIARQNGIPAQRESFAQSLAWLDAPDYTQLEAIAREAGSWAQYPEDIALLVYDIGVALSKQNIVYAEIMVAPPDFIGSSRMSMEVFIEALNDGRDRALRAWQVDMAWVLCIPRDNPRSGDGVARWAAGSAAPLSNVVAMGLTGAPEPQPIGQFKRAFDTARKKELLTVFSATSGMEASEIGEALDELMPQRLTEPGDIGGDQDLLERLAAGSRQVVLSLCRQQRLAASEEGLRFPLRSLIDSKIPVALSSGMPSLYKSTLVDEYMLAHERCELSLEELIALARRSIELAFLDAERKDTLLRRFDFDVKAARARWLPGR